MPQFNPDFLQFLKLFIISLGILCIVYFYIRNKYKNEKNLFKRRKSLYDEPREELPRSFFDKKIVCGEEIDEIEKNTYH